MEICTGVCKWKGQVCKSQKTRWSLGHPSSIILTTVFTTYWTGSRAASKRLIHCCNKHTYRKSFIHPVIIQYICLAKNHLSDNNIILCITIHHFNVLNKIFFQISCKKSGSHFTSELDVIYLHYLSFFVFWCQNFCDVVLFKQQNKLFCAFV